MHVRAVILVLCAVGPVRSQIPGMWKNSTAMEVVRVTARDASTVWAGTQGGVFAVDVSSRAARQFTAAEGLSTNDVSAIAVVEGTIWIGAADGSVDVLGREGVSKRITDIRESQRIRKSVRTFCGIGDTVLIGTDFGISVYRISREQFGDTYASFGFPAPTGVNDIEVLNNELWIATDYGIARANRFAGNLVDPAAWQLYANIMGSSASVRALGIVRDTLVAATQAGVAYFDGTGFQAVTNLTGKDVAAVSVVGEELYAVWNDAGGFTLEKIDGVTGPVQTIGTVPWGSATGLAGIEGGGIPWVATNFQGMAVNTGGGWEYAVPNGPKSNSFASLAVDDSGVLWCATGISGMGRGFSRYDPSRPEGSRWKNFTVIENPIMGSNDYFKVGLGGNGSVWISSWGNGVVEMAGDTIRRRLDATSTPALSGSVDSDPFYVVMNGVAAGGDGSTWLVNWGARSGNYLVRLTSDTLASYFTHSIAGQGYFTSLAVDQYGTKWMAGAQPFHPTRAFSLYYFNENLSVAGTSATGGWGVMTEADGLPDGVVFSVAVDKTGSVCVGTEHGLMIISEPLFPKQRHFSSFPLREQAIQAIAVDAINNKWVGTREGVFVMNADATRILQQHTVASSGGRLPSNDIRSLAIDQRRGIVYIGTERGLASLTIVPVEPKEALSALEIGPNPFFLPAHSVVEIRNLVEESSIKILRVDGSLVTEFRAQGGGRALWDGRDREGRLVSSGVYFVVAHAQDGDEVTTAKLAIIRKQ